MTAPNDSKFWPETSLCALGVVLLRDLQNKHDQYPNTFAADLRRSAVTLQLLTEQHGKIPADVQAYIDRMTGKGPKQ